MTNDTRFTYGVVCTWRGPIQNVGVRDNGLPCCPHCGGVLFEMETKDIWDKQIVDFDKKHPGYADFQSWLAALASCIPLKTALDTYVDNGGAEPPGIRVT